MQTNIVRHVALLLLTVICSRNLYAQDDSAKEQYMHMEDDSTHVPPVTTFTYRHGALYTIGMAGDSILSFSIDGRKIPREEWSGYKDRIAETVQYVREARVRLAQDRLQLARDRDQLALNRQQLEINRQQADMERVQAAKAREEAELARSQADLERAQAGKAREEAERERRLAMLDMDRHLNNQKAQLQEQQQALRDARRAMEDQERAEQSRLLAEKEREQGEYNRMLADRGRMQAEREREQAERNREAAERDRQLAEEDRKIFQDNLAGDLVKDGIVPNKDSIRSIELDPHHVSVNGKRLPAALEKKYIEKYAGNGRSMSYHHDDGN